MDNFRRRLDKKGGLTLSYTQKSIDAAAAYYNIDIYYNGNLLKNTQLDNISYYVEGSAESGLISFYYDNTTDSNGKIYFHIAANENESASRKFYINFLYENYSAECIITQSKNSISKTTTVVQLENYKKDSSISVNDYEKTQVKNSYGNAYYRSITVNGLGTVYYRTGEKYNYSSGKEQIDMNTSTNRQFFYDPCSICRFDCTYINGQLSVTAADYAPVASPSIVYGSNLLFRGNMCFSDGTKTKTSTGTSISGDLRMHITYNNPYEYNHNLQGIYTEGLNSLDTENLLHMQLDYNTSTGEFTLTVTPL